MKKKLFFKAGLFLMTSLAFLNQKTYSQTPTLDFAKVLQTTHDQGVWSRATATDANGNFYMTGLFHGTVDFDTSNTGYSPLVYQGGTENDTNGESDVFIAKYGPEGNLIWSKKLLEPTFGGMNEERGSALIIDANNNLFLTGFTTTRGFFVSKWNSNGDEIWTRYFDNTLEDRITSFAIRKKGNSILVSGFLGVTADFDPSPVNTVQLTSFNNNDGFLLSLSEEGNFEWVKQFRTNGAVLITGLEVDNDNNIYLSGTFVGTLDVNPDPTVNVFITSESNSFAAISSAFLAKFNSNGELLWNRHLKGDSLTDFFMVFIKKDNNNNIILSGSVDGAVTFLPTSTIINSTNYNSFLAKYDTSGNVIWANHFSSPVGTQSSSTFSLCANVIVDNCNNIYVSGEFQGSLDFNPSSIENIEVSTINNSNAFVAAYAPGGDYLWSMKVAGPGNVAFVDFNGYLPIALDNNNDLVFTGTFRQQLDFDPSQNTTMLSSNSVDSNIAGVFIAKYDNPINSCQLNNSQNRTNIFNINPNPTNGLFTVSMKEYTPATISIYDISGKLLLTENLTTAVSTVDIGYFTKGVYIVMLTTEGKSSHQKLVLK